MIITVSRQSTEWRRRLVNALCRLEHDAPTIEQTDEYAFARRMVSAIYDNWREPYVVACYYTFGVHPEKLQERLEARRALRQWELYRAIPDYDPQEDKRAHVVKAGEVRRSASSGGTLHQMPTAQKSQKPKSVRAMPQKGPRIAAAR